MTVAELHQQVVDKLQGIFDRNLSDPEEWDKKPERRIKGSEFAWSAIYLPYVDLVFTPELQTLFKKAELDTSLEYYVLRLYKERHPRKTEQDYELGIFIPMSELSRIPAEVAPRRLKFRINQDETDIELSEFGDRSSGKIGKLAASSPLDRLALIEDLVDTADRGIQTGARLIKLQSNGFGYSQAAI